MYLAEICVKCNECGANFATRQIPVLVDEGDRDSEFRPLQRQDDGSSRPHPYVGHSVAVCPSCLHADWAASFATGEQALALPSAWESEPPHLQLRRAALDSERRQRGFYPVAMFYLHAAWCADDCGAWTQAGEYRRLAVISFRKSLESGECPPARRALVDYLQCELLRRVSDFEACQNHARAIISSLPGRYALLVRKTMKMAIDKDSNAFVLSPAGIE